MPIEKSKRCKSQKTDFGNVNMNSQTTLSTECAPYKKRKVSCDGKKTTRKRKLIRGSDIVLTTKRRRLSDEKKENAKTCEYCSCKDPKPNKEITQVTYSTDYKAKLRNRSLDQQEYAKRYLDETNEIPEEQEVNFSKNLRNRIIIPISNYKKGKKKNRKKGIQKSRPTQITKVIKKDKHEEIQKGECESKGDEERSRRQVGKYKKKGKVVGKTKRKNKREGKGGGKQEKECENTKGNNKENPNALKVRESTEVNNDRVCQSINDEINITTAKIKVLLDPESQCYTGEIEYINIQKTRNRKATNCNKYRRTKKIKIS
ncbi:uncharacterized protein LOC119687604 [Teleopsis dalmanni]|uniref:uncharacterized protein LOC119687604 n=1 Tax=Teleopsis dalmanni TaxID=139649 RepID=UPI0018CD9E28|nr:uncharacterized protein LOC119687604 [Teleopsis dalmanni]XP_037957911.1 uncharacterized protein LOC119687604 [Teleopsis dalmanni]